MSPGTAPITLPPPPPAITAAQRVPVPAYGPENGVSPTSVIPALPAPTDPLSPAAATAGDTLAPTLGSANIDVYDQGPNQGAHVALVYPQDVNQLASGGRWSDLQLTPTAAADGWTDVNGGVTVTFPSVLQASTPITESFTQGTLTIAPVGVNATGTLSGTTITYASALPSTDLVYAAVPAGFREEAFLNSAKASPTLDYQIQATGCH